MPKLKLEIEELSVESFDTAAPSGQRGTAFGHSRIVDTDNPHECGSGDSYAAGDQAVLAGTCGGGGWSVDYSCEGASCLDSCFFQTCSCTVVE